MSIMLSPRHDSIWRRRVGPPYNYDLLRLGGHYRPLPGAHPRASEPPPDLRKNPPQALPDPSRSGPGHRHHRGLRAHHRPPPPDGDGGISRLLLSAAEMDG